MGKSQSIQNRANAVYVVGIGASAGGLEALQSFFNNVPSTTGMAFVIVQHLSPNFKSFMNELLAKHTTMRIKTAEDETEIEPNTIYLNRRDKNIVCEQGKLILKDRDPEKILNLPIDMFFHSLGEEFAEKAIAVILSGTGSDGSRGIRTIKEAGGTIMVQEPTTAQFDGMPNSAIRTNLAEFIQSPTELAKILTDLPKRSNAHERLIQEGSNQLFHKIIEEISVYSGNNFHEYKNSTIARRLQKRMDIRGIDTLEDYLAFMKDNDKEKELVSKEFLIGVTNFFRNPEAFHTLTSKVFPRLFKKDDQTKVYRIWISGCSSGEEAYSIAILIDEYLKNTKSRADFKIFATDIDKEAIYKASGGHYPINILTDVNSERIQNYFLKTGEQYRITKRIREKIVFSYHNVLQDPPFIRMDMITCRNLLIYMQPNAQEQILHKFQFALNPGGFLFLGNSENIGKLKGSFEEIDSKWKIYRNSETSEKVPNYANAGFTPARYQNNSYKKTEFPSKPYQKPKKGQLDYNQLLVDRYAPPCLIVDSDLSLKYMRGNMGKFLHIREGAFSDSLPDMINDNLTAIIRDSIKRLQRKDTDSVQINDIPVEKDDGKVSITIKIQEASLTHDAGFIISIIGEEELPQDQTVIEQLDLDDLTKKRFTEMEDTIATLKEEKQNIVEELETSNEELQSSNEELLASNEELQSTNEELQSVNEELYTVNTELQIRNKELSEVNADMDNLLASTQIATLFLDFNLKIRKFTPDLKRIFRLEDSDIGRPIHDFVSNFVDVTSSDLIEHAKTVMKTRDPLFREVESKDGSYFLKRITPFLKADQSVDGCVITFIDITQLQSVEREVIHQSKKIKEQNKILQKKSQQLYDTNHALKQSEERFRGTFEHAAIGIAHVSTKGEIILTNERLCSILGRPKEKLQKQYVQDVITSKEEPNISELLNTYLEKHETISGKEICVSHQKDNSQWIELTISPLENENGNLLYHIAVIDDITVRKKTEQQLFRAHETLELAFDAGKIAWWDWNYQSGVLEYDSRKATMLNYSKEELENTMECFRSRVHPEDLDSVETSLSDYINGKLPAYTTEYRIKKKNGEYLTVYERAEIVKRDSRGQPKRIIGVTFDISEKKLVEQALASSEDQFTFLFATMAQGVVYHNKDGSIISANAAAEQILGLSRDQILGKKSIDPNWHCVHEDGSTFPGEEHPAMESLRTGKPVKDVTMGVFNPRDGGYKWIKVNTKPIYRNNDEEPDMVYASFEDISGLKEKEFELEKAVREKEVLLREIHHRVKNNLQKIISLLNLQTSKIDDPYLSSAFEESKNRIYTMALIHQKLYFSEDLASVKFSEYVKSLVLDLLGMYSVNDSIEADIQIEEAQGIDIDTIIANGLIINELVSNAVKYAFPRNKQNCRISISGEILNHQKYQVTFQDNGRGFPENFEENNQLSLGMRLINALCTQLRGSISFKNRKGAMVLFTFPINVNEQAYLKPKRE